MSETATLVYTRTYLGRIASAVYRTKVPTSIEQGDPIVAKLELTGEWLALAHSDAPDTLNRLTKAFPYERLISVG